MSKRKDAQQIQRFLRDADRDLAKGLTVSDVCRKHGVSTNTYHRWRRRFDPTQVDDARRVRELETEVERPPFIPPWQGGTEGGRRVVARQADAPGRR